MRFEVTVAIRYLRSSGLQTVLILLGVAMGVMAFTFIASLINGLQDRLVEDILGNLPHVTLEPEERIAAVIVKPEGARVLLGRQETSARRPEITGWRAVVEQVEREAGVTAVSPQAVGGGFIRRAGETAPVTVTGVEPLRVSAIVDVDDGLLRGSTQLAPGDVIIGSDLAEELDLTVGQRIMVQSERERERALTVRGIFDIGTAGVNERLLLLDLGTAQSLLELEGAISRVEIKVADIYVADAVARRLGAMTGLEATSWMEENESLQDALDAQNNSANLIKFFSMITIVIAVASALLVAALRRSAEIGIMRSMGVRRRSVMAIFVLQGLLIGLIGSVIGSLLGWVFLHVLREATLQPDGTSSIPVDPALGEYPIAITIATVASALAAFVPARSAARVDPVEVLQT